MSRDIFPSLSGAIASARQIELVANNVANQSTVGFKAQRGTFEQVNRSFEPLANSYVKLSPGYPDLSDGPLIEDGGETHLALQGRGFLVVEGGEGQGGQLLCRGGALRLDRDGFLVTDRGEKVLGESGPIQVPENEHITVDQAGKVSTTRGDELAQLRLVVPSGPPGSVEELGGTRWLARAGTRPATEVVVVQGALEGSNTNPVKEMVDLIQATRYFELYQKAMQTSDELDGRMYATGRG